MGEDLSRNLVRFILFLTLSFTIPSVGNTAGLDSSSNSLGNLNGISPLEILRAPNSLARARAAYTEVRNEPDIKTLLGQTGQSSLILTQKLSGPSQIETSKFQHYYQGIEVMGSMAFHHLGSSHTSIRNHLARFNLDTHPTLSAESAASLAQAVGNQADLKSPPSLKILPQPGKGSAQLIYWVELKSKGEKGAEDILIDAHSGSILGQLSHDYTFTPVQVYSAKNQGIKTRPRIAKDPKTGKSTLTNCDITDLSTGETTQMDKASCIALYRGDSPQSKSQCQVIDGMQGFPLDINASHCAQYVQDSVVKDRSDPSILDAANNSKLVLDYYESHFGRRSFDDKGSELVSVIHAGEKMANAFWMVDLNTMVYGDGDGEEMGDLTQAVDVAGHEMTHGVTAHTANLMMMGESGALNEAFSDFFGKLIENQGDWVIGRKLFLSEAGPKGIRDLANPANLQSTVINSDGNPIEKAYPATKAEAAQVPDGEACDNSNDRCWVHFNSTIPSHAAYLVYQAIGQTKAELLYYTALTQNLSSTDDFKSSTQAILTTCKDLDFSASDCERVKDAYRDVGLI